MLTVEHAAQAYRCLFTGTFDCGRSVSFLYSVLLLAQSSDRAFRFAFAAQPRGAPAVKSHRCAHAPPALAHTTQVAKHSAEALLSCEEVVLLARQPFHASSSASIWT
jgi:hypothetical protein